MLGDPNGKCQVQNVVIQGIAKEQLFHVERRSSTPEKLAVGLLMLLFTHEYPIALKEEKREKGKKGEKEINAVNAEKWNRFLQKCLNPKCVESNLFMLPYFTCTYCVMLYYSNLLC